MSLLGWLGADDSEKDDEDEERVTIVEEREETKEYTVHLATATFADGTTKRYMFDHMERDGNGDIVLADYAEFEVITQPYPTLSDVEVRTYHPLKKFATITRQNLNDFVTDQRRTVEVSNTYKSTQQADRSTAEEFVRGHDDRWIQEDT